MLSFGICDDNLHFAAVLMKKLHELCALHLPERVDCRILPSFGCADDVMTFMKSQQINVLFLDIDMPKVNGFRLAEHISANYPETIIIFVSSYEDFVFSSFEYSPFRFLRKSHLTEELPLTFKKVIDKCLLEKETLSFVSTDGEQLLRAKDIILFEAQKNYYVVKTTSPTSYKCRGTLGSVEESVKNFDFYRVNSSYIINLEHMAKVENDFVTMKTGEVISISRNKSTLFKSEYMQYLRRRITK